jgi:hypothetical protein
MSKPLVAILLVAAFSAGCSELTGAKSQGRVAVRFSTETAAGSRSLSGGASFALAGSAADELVVTGSNGTLRIDDLRMIVSEFELERASGSCAALRGEGRDDDEDDDDEGEECDEFESGPFLLDLALGGGATTVATDAVPEGNYSAVKFEVEDLEVDDDDDAKEQRSFQDILGTLRQSYPAFPPRASMVVHGSFTPTGGTAQPFTVYLRAELEIERELVPPLSVPGDNALTVTVDPATWFTSSGRVVNLAALDGRTVEMELRSGFKHARGERD